MKIYISGPITGTNDYFERFSIAEQRLNLKNHLETINPALILAPMPESTTHEEYMRICMDLLDMADAVYMLKGWETSHGASIEYGYAMARDMNIIEEGECDEKL